MYEVTSIAGEENADLFQRKELLPPEALDEKAHSYSRLSDLLESSMSMGENPFLEYAKFDGKVNIKEWILSFCVSFPNFAIFEHHRC